MWVVVVGIGCKRVDVGWRSSRNIAKREWGRVNRVDTEEREEATVASMRTIGSGSKDTTPIADPRTASFVKGTTTCNTRVSKTHKNPLFEPQGIFICLRVVVHFAKPPGPMRNHGSVHFRRDGSSKQTI